MTQTVTSGSSSYCTGTQFLVFYDARTVAQLLSDTDVPIGSNSDGTVNPVTVAADASLTALLEAAAGELEGVALLGGRYQVADLQALAGTNAGQLLAKLNAAIAVQELLQRRPDVDVPPLPQLERALAWLESLEDGRAIFGTQETQEAGTLDDQQEYAADVERRNLNTYQARRFFGRRGNRNDP